MKIEVIFFASLVALYWASSEAAKEWIEVGGFSYSLLKDENHIAKLSRDRHDHHVSHDLEVHLVLQYCQCNHPFELWLIENGAKIFSWKQQPNIQQGECHFHLHVNKSIPVGQYGFHVRDPCSKNKARLSNMTVVFSSRPDKPAQKRVRRQTDSFNAEYINNNNGLIWRYRRPVPWNYAVGSTTVINSRNRLMGLMTQAERSDNVLYARALTRLINSHILIGRWDGNYNDGVEPTQWVGSEDILARWMRTNQTRVRYGQCWVFAGLLTTLLRASNIPARTVTNIGSHHDRGLTNARTAVLRQYDNIKQADESVWNFHVWSEAWLARPDLGQPFGWNAVDATPQEPSPLLPGQPFQTGPAYVPYVRANARTAQYDTLFVLAEVNAQEFCPITGARLPSKIGYAVLTKRPGRARTGNYNVPEDITSTYKIQSVSKRDTYDPVLPPPFIGCEREGGLRMNITPSTPLVGDDFTLNITEGSVPEADIVIRMEFRNYMGESLGSIRNFTGTRRLDITESSYLPFLGESSIFLFTVGTFNSTGNFIFHDSLRITLDYNQMEVDASRDDDTNSITLMITYTNPLSVPLTGVMVNVAGPDDAYMRIAQPDIAANARFTATISVECGESDDSDVMIPVSLDSNVTQSVYGTGWSTCAGESSSGGLVMITESSVMQVIAISLAVCVYFIN